MIFHIKIKVEVPDEVQHEDILRDHVDCRACLIAFFCRLKHVAPDSHLVALLSKVIIHSVNVFSVKLGMILILTLGAKTDLINLVMAHMNITLRLCYFYDFVYDIINYLIALLVLRTICVVICYIRRLILVTCILDIVYSFFFSLFSNFGMRECNVLNMSEGLYFRYDLKSEGRLLRSFQGDRRLQPDRAGTEEVFLLLRAYCREPSLR